MALSSSILRSGFSSLWRSSTTFHHSLKMLSATSNYCQMRDSSATNTGISKVSCCSVHTDVRKGKRTYTDVLSYIGGFSEPCLEQKQLIDKFINLCTKGGKKTKSRAIAYQTLQRLAGTEGVTKLLEQAVGNVKPICELDKVRVAGTTYHVPDFVHRDRQQTLAIRWILEAASKRRTSKRISLDQCLSAEILDAYRKRGIARKKRDDIHQEASKNRSFVHFRWS